MVRAALILLAFAAAGCAKANPQVPDDGGFDAPPAECQPTGAEICNDLDDDCDTFIDNGFNDKGQECTVGMGACQATGVYVCATDTTVTCDAMPGSPEAEDCDGIDDDCDGRIDEDFDVGTPCDGADNDVCADGVIVCTGPMTTTCNDTLANDPERCDTFDNDCDGNVDEGFNLTMPCDGGDLDQCIEGQIVCDGMGGTTCSDMSTTNLETCNRADDNCNGQIDELWNVGAACSDGLGECKRNGQMECNGTGTGVVCNAIAAAPQLEICGNSLDEDCTGADAVCPVNDLATGAIDISASGTFTVDLSAARDNNWVAGVGCGDQGGRDVFYQFTLPAPEVVYYDTLNADFDSVVRIFPGACTALGAVIECSNDACATTRSQGAVNLAAGTYCLVVDQFSSAVTAGMSSLVFKRGGRSGVELATPSGTVSGTTEGGTNLTTSTCEAQTNQPEVAHFFTTCLGTKTVNADVCSAGTTFDTVMYVKTGSGLTGTNGACSDDVPGCGNGLRSKIPNTSESTASSSKAVVTGPNLHWIIVDGFGISTSGRGPYTLTYSIQ